MKVVKTNIELEEALSEYSKAKLKIGFLPTMGALHQGHIHLAKLSSDENDITIVSIFVNPKQFNNQEDFDKYPMTVNEDIALLEKVECDLVYIPNMDEIYPKEHKSVKVDLGILDKVFEGPMRPGHFDGVVQVVHRLFSLVRPDRAYFGLKDYQQCMVIKALRNQYFPEIELRLCPTVRTEKGLAMSSRNKRLSDKGLESSLQIYKSLKTVMELKKHIEPNDAIKFAVHQLENNGIKVEYFALANADTLIESRKWLRSGKNVVLVAVWIEGVRLIDNMIF